MEFSFLYSSSLLSFIIGIAATILTRYSSIPQIIKGFKTKKMDDVFDIQRDHVRLIKDAAALLAPGAVLYFSTNFRRFKFDYDALSGFHVEDISASTIPEDFARNPKIHYCWRIQA